MPRTMFEEVVSPQARAQRHWYTLPLSFLVHTTVLAILVVVPLVATDVLPVPRVVLHFVGNDFTPVIPTPPPAVPSRSAAPPAVTLDTTSAPLVAPDTIGQESGVIFQQDTIATETLDGIVSGLGTSQGAVIEAGPPPAVAPEMPVRLASSGIKPPARTRYVEPQYPEIARHSRVEGVVIIEAIIGVDGTVRNARILRSHPLLDDAALSAVRAWEYTPTLLNGRPTAVIMTVTVRFDLN